MRLRVRIVAAYRFWLLLALFFVSSSVIGRPALAGSEDNVTGWAWSGTIGWIATNCTALGDCSGSDFGMTIRSTPGVQGSGDITGYAWSETMGWICFGTTCTGTTPEGAAPYAQYRASWKGKTDQLFGWAKVVSMGDNGWISLNCDHDIGASDCATSSYYSVLDISTGNFVKAAEPLGHWAWGGNSDGTGIGWMDLSAVTTSWVPSKLGKVVRPEGIYEPQNPGLPGTHLSTFDITVMDFWAAAGQRLDCSMLLPDGSTRSAALVVPATVRGGTTTLSYTVQNADNVQIDKIWYLNDCRIGEVPGSTACVNDTPCLPFGYCDTGLGFCRIITAENSQRAPIYTHGNTWTGLQYNQDQYDAVKCFTGFPDTYFKNAAQCDFTGDLAFSLLMRRGIPLEGNCNDTIDNDNNGEVDCVDRACGGISYRCQTLPRTSCIYGSPTPDVKDCTDLTYSVGDLCCDRQPLTEGSAYNHVVDGMECKHGDPNDGYFDCDCTSAAQFNASPTDDCFAPGAQAGDFCCNTDNVVEKL